MSQEIIKLMLQGIEETFYMVAVATVIGGIIGIPLGITLVTTSKGHILENRFINQILGTIVNIIRSIPFIILMVAIIPLTRLIAGTSIGTTAACVPLTIVAIPFLSRLVETSIRDVDFGLVEAAESMGATPFQIIRKVLIPEALPTIINNITVLIVNLIGASAMAGAIGGGGSGTSPSATATSDSVPTSCWRRSSSSSSSSTSSRPAATSHHEKRIRNKY